MTRVTLNETQARLDLDANRPAETQSQVWRQHLGKVAWPTLLLSIALLLGVVAVWGAVLGKLLPLWLGAILMIGIDYAWFTPLHEAVHGNISGRQSHSWLDGLIGCFAATSFCAPYPAFKALHLRHHCTVNRPGRDPDLWVAGRSKLETALRCLSILPYYYATIFGLVGEPSVFLKSYRRQSFLAFGLIGASVALLTSQGLAMEALLLWFLPGLIAGGMLAYVFDYMPHHPHEGIGRYDNARIILGGPLLTVLTGWHNYHLIHHLYPRVPFFRYGQVFFAMRVELESKGARIDER